MNLAIDIGNTRTKIGLFSGNKLAEKLVWTEWSIQDLVRYAKEMHVTNAIVSSVAAPDSVMTDALTSITNLINLSHTTPIPFENQYTTPETLGKDRLAAVAGARSLFPETSCLVIDCGTCIKYDFIKDGITYLGGNIAPGIAMRINAMHHFTARLPVVPMILPEDMIGFSTTTALQNGAVRGAILEIEGFIDQFNKKYKNTRVVLTGGDAGFVNNVIQPLNPNVEPDIVLLGLNHILDFNT